MSSRTAAMWKLETARSCIRPHLEVHEDMSLR